jgi:hypothetical protein
MHVQHENGARLERRMGRRNCGDRARQEQQERLSRNISWSPSAAGTAGAALSQYFMVSDTLVHLNVASNKIGAAKPE